MPTLTPQQFVDKWERTDLKERASTQEHFMDLCHLVGHPTPAEQDPTGESFCFEAGGKTTTGGQGYADVWYKGHFAIEYKGKGQYSTLDAAYQQLLKYREYLGNPPLLIVTDIERWEIHTNWTNSRPDVLVFTNSDILNPANQRILHDLFFNPEALNPKHKAKQVTEQAAEVFGRMADEVRRTDQLLGRTPDAEKIARFISQLVFCLFAEDARLLPFGPGNEYGILTEILKANKDDPAAFARYLGDLFMAMAEGGHVLFKRIPFFNGNLFKDAEVLPLSRGALAELEKASELDWMWIDPSIFGTLFERTLDPAKRAQLGAHYTSRDDILLIVDPVLMQPLRLKWDTIKAEAQTLRQQHDQAQTERIKVNRRRELGALRETMLRLLRETKVLDPACGSGNFLYVSLQALKDLEHAVITDPVWQDIGLTLPIREVRPKQMFGIEKDEIAHQLASIVVWIGYIQWNVINAYIPNDNPILEPLDNIKQMDAILACDEAGNPVEPEWPSVDVIVSNPPFLGGKKLRGELGDHYIDTLYSVWPEMHGEADLVTYWFEKARHQLHSGRVKRVGMLATNSIRGGANREVLKRIKETGDIFMAWSDRNWILDGAAVRVSMIGFDDGSETTKTLDGVTVNTINPDLTRTVDITIAEKLPENRNTGFMGITPTGRFQLDGNIARSMLVADATNKDVLRPYLNGMDITRRSSSTWIVDFTNSGSLEAASQYELPMGHVVNNVKPFRDAHKTAKLRENWWLFEAPRPEMREALRGLERYIATPTVAKHRLFVWLTKEILPDHQLIVIARSDDYFFGVLHSRFHEKWALRMGTSLEDRPRYTPTTTFETFPFPWPPGQEPVGPHPKSLPHEEGGTSTAHSAAFLPSPLVGEGLGMGGNSPLVGEGNEPQVRGMGGTPDRWIIPPELARKMTEIARQLRKNPTASEDRLWQAIRKDQLEGRKFRRQMPIGPFVVDFYCSSERLILEVDGPIHESQREADHQRQVILESMGLRFVRVTVDQVENDLSGVLDTIRAAFGVHPHPIIPHEEGGANPQGSRGWGAYAAYRAISDAAAQLHAERDAWLNPPGMSERALKDRTLTNLYNALLVFRGDPPAEGKSHPKIVPAAGDFAPRLLELHAALDRAVCAAYGWDYAVLDDEEEILRRLLALNLERAASATAR